MATNDAHAGQYHLDYAGIEDEGEQASHEIASADEGDNDGEYLEAQAEGNSILPTTTSLPGAAPALLYIPGVNGPKMSQTKW